MDEEMKEEKQTPLQIVEERYPNLLKSFRDQQQKNLELFCSKHLDYGMENISQRKDMSTKKGRWFSLFGLLFRVNDKIARWENLIQQDNAKNEPLVDTYQDIANYGTIASLVDEGKWVKG